MTIAHTYAYVCVCNLIYPQADAQYNRVSVYISLLGRFFSGSFLKGSRKVPSYKTIQVY